MNNESKKPFLPIPVGTCSIDSLDHLVRKMARGRDGGYRLSQWQLAVGDPSA